MNGEWLPHTSSTRTLDEDLKARGYLLWWRADDVTVTAPDGWQATFAGQTVAAIMRNAYASAQEHEAAQISAAWEAYQFAKAEEERLWEEHKAAFRESQRLYAVWEAAVKARGGRP
ncbi:hypothetical protein DESA109040_13825 [Deinococcus saxicola]|uniref:hypothetical protein n=1 Tax=Deinococcus saxicola TaxID=249406 RepID=UPI0039EF4CA1